jgi:hypothetical protein
LGVPASRASTALALRVNLLFNGAVVSEEWRPPRFLKAMTHLLILTHIFLFLLGFLSCLALWALRECERREVFEYLCERIEALCERNVALRDENEALRQTDGLCRQIVTNVHAGLGKLRREFSLGGKVALPAPASPKVEGLEVNMQHFSQRSQRITARLTGLPGSGSPDFLGGE